LNKAISILAFLLIMGSLSAETTLPIYCTSVNAGTPIIINGTAGLSIAGNSQTTWTTCEGGTPTVHYNDSADYLVANSSGRMPMDMEAGTGTSYIPSAVWTSDASVWGIYHLNEASGNALDSTNQRNLTEFGTVGVDTGYFAGARSGFSTSNYFKEASTQFSSANNSTVCAWLSPISANTGQQLFVATDYSSGKFFYVFGYNTTESPNKFSVKIWKDGQPVLEATLASTMIANAWYYTCSRYDGSTGKFNVFSNGLKSADVTYNQAAASQDDGVLVGYDPSLTGYTASKFIIDELRFYTSYKSDDWLNQTYKNGLGTAGYGTFSNPGVPPPVINQLAIFNSTGATGTIFATGNPLYGFLNATDNAAMNVTWKYYVNGTANATGNITGITNNTLVNIANVSGASAFSKANWTLEAIVFGAGGNTVLNSTKITIDLDPYALTACQNLTEAGATYTLENDLTVASITCFNQTAENITLNCNGHSITSNDAAGSPWQFYGYQSNENGTTINGCRFYGFDAGIGLYNQEQNRGMRRGLINNSVASGVNAGLLIRGGEFINITNSNFSCINNDAVYLDDADRATHDLVFYNVRMQSTAEYGMSFYAGVSGGTKPVENVTVTHSFINGTDTDIGGAIGLGRANNITFLNNLITGDPWVTNTVAGVTGTPTNIKWNNSTAGNKYIYANGTGSWEFGTGATWSCTSDCPWADAGTLPVNSTNFAAVWKGATTGGDYHPYTTTNGTSALACRELNETGMTYNMTGDISSNTTCFTATAANVALDCAGFSITGNNSTGTYGIYSNKANTTIKNCNIQNFKHGIYFNAANNGTITNTTSNTTFLTGIGIYLVSSSNNTITDSIGSSISYYGIKLDFGSNHNVISGSTGISNSGAGIYLVSSSNNTITNSAGTGINGGTGIVLDISTDSTILNSNGTANTGIGIYIFSSSNNTITNSTGASNSNIGVYLALSSNNIVANSQISGLEDTYGAAFIESSTGNTIANNTIDGNGGMFAMTLQTPSGAATGNTIINNTILDASFLLYLDSGTANNTFYWNNFTNPANLYIFNDGSGNSFNTTISGKGEGNIYGDVLAGTAIVLGNTSSAYGGGLVIGKLGTNYPFGAATSALMDGATDYAPLTNQILGTFPNCTALEGAGTYTMTTDAAFINSTCFLITAPNVTLDCDGHTITGAATTDTYGIYSDKDNTTIRNCIIEGFDDGIYLKNAYYGLITNTSSTGNGTEGGGTPIRNAGIWIYGGGNHTIANSTGANYKGFINSGLGILLEYSSYNTIINTSAIAPLGNGLTLHHSNWNTMTNGYASSGEDYPIWFNYANNNTITSFEADGEPSGRGIGFLFSNDNTANRINSHGQSLALGISYGNRNNISDSTFTGIMTASSMYQATYNRIINNTFGGGNGTFDLITLNDLSYGNVFCLDNISTTGRNYIADANGTNSYNCTYDGKNQGNIWADVINGSISVSGNISSSLTGYKIGTGGAGVPYNYTKSAKFDCKFDGCADYAPLFILGNFNYDGVPSFLNPEFAGTYDNIFLNVSFVNYTGARSAILRYDGADFASDTVNYTNGTIFNHLVLVPSKANVSMTWWLFLPDAGVIATYNNTTSIDTINFTYCTANQTPMINFTFYDQENPIVPVSSTMDATFLVTSANGLFSQNISLNFSIANTSQTVCMNISNGTYYVNSIQVYTAPGYRHTYYYLLNASLTNPITLNVSLFNLNVSSSTLTQYTVIEGANQPVTNAYVQILRYYPSTNQIILVSMGKTDENGLTSSYVVPNIVNYQYIIVKDYRIYYTSNVAILPCDPVATLCQHTILINKGGNNPYQAFVGAVGVGCWVNASASVVYCTSNNPSGTGTDLTLNLWEMTTYGKTLVCTNTISSGSGTVACNVPDIAGKSYYYEGTVTIGSWQDIGRGLINGTIAAKFDSTTGLFATALVVIIFSLVGMIGGLGTSILAATFGIVFSAMFGFFSIGLVPLSGIILVGLVMAYILRV